MQNPSLDALEERAYRTAVDHGFFDLLLATGVATFTLAIAVSPWCILALFALVIGKQWALKVFNQRVVEPRLGHVRLGAVRLDQISTSRKTVALAFFGLALLVSRLGEMGSPVSAAAPLAWLADTPQFQIAIVAGVATAVAGWLFGLPRFLAYGAVIVLCPLLASLVELPAGTGWMMATVIILAAGGRVLYRFIHQHPTDGGGAHGA